MSDYFWTSHAQYKMKQYGLSAQRVKRVIRAPFRTEEGIVENTVAVMQPVSERRLANGKKVWKNEIWVMYVIKPKAKGPKPKVRIFEPKQLRIISAWKYPGISPKRNPIPEEILREIRGIAGI